MRQLQQPLIVFYLIVAVLLADVRGNVMAVVRFGWLVGITMGSAMWIKGAVAQITPDSTLPNNSIVTLNGSTFNITGGAQTGSNLFHSFQDFSVPTGSTASFNNTVDIQNIISRVTGGSVSDIDGLIKANGSANLFLINPNGIIFGENASLNVGGSFVASTANAIQFGEQGFFSATNLTNNAPLLTVNPSALFFNQIAAPIQNNSVAPAGTELAGFDVFGLRVPDGKSLLLIGGNINMDRGQLNAYGGRVELGGLADSGTVALNVNGDNVSAGFPTESAFADVSLTNRASVWVEAGNSGSIIINARNLDITKGSTLSAGIGQGLGSDGSVAGDIALNATGEITVVDSNIVNNVRADAVGNAGNIRISADFLELTNGAQLQANTSGKGDAGNVIIDVRGNVSFDNMSAAFSTVERTGEGKGGNVQISADSLELTNGAQLLASTRGKGDAGNVIIDVRGNVSFNGTSSDGRFFSAAFSRSAAESIVNEGAVGKGGNVQISADSLSLTNFAQLVADTRGKGDAGNVIIDVRGNVSFDNISDASSTVERTGEGKGGNVQISADSLSLTNGAQLLASTRGKGDAGNVIIDVRGNVSFNNISTAYSSVERTGEGKGGNVQISADSLSLTNGAQLLASTRGKGDAGNVIIDVRGNVSFDNMSAASSTVERTGEGKGGNVQINADSLSLTNVAELLASTRGKGDAGNVIIDVRGNVSFDNMSTAFSTVERTGEGKGGNVQISADSLSLTNGAQLLASTRGKGDAGKIEINAPNRVSVSGTSSITGLTSALFTSTFPSSTGIGGDIIVNTTNLRVSDGAVLDTRTNNNGNGGNITLNVRQAEILNGGQLLSTSSSAGNAGKITVNATDRVIVDGSDRTFNDRVAQFGRAVSPIDDSSGVFVRAQSTGSAGSIEITTPQIRLDNTATISAESESGSGGNINLFPTNFLIHRRGSQISTSAGTAQQSGDGGNIDINTPNGFIIAVPNENSDISANAFEGQGGIIKINATGIYGIAPLSREDLQRNSPGLNPSEVPTSDITAISQTNPTLSGTIELNTPEVDPNSGLVELPTIPVDTEVAQGCYTPGYAQSSFVITGRGGLPPNPKDILTPDATQIDWVSVKPSNNNRFLPPVTTKPTTSIPKRIVEATGATLNAKGQIVLTANSSTVTPLTSKQNPPQCHGHGK
ncbi:filamentous hemagglutinin N-terminal domain-containing protein [Plectonema cf. radiosum LEGE 06105]|uniref:Filamentous hemagglutinin N-terminal domain-containing protein n=1 Tax=Plectonema cf. radiosum LEGE 06105 TaxID=945769 RepID=A0A8J7F357_9CYAN|nr:filamentous hemagglutinin N-terminal domain-containing protein [Plectonema radiosum]MBE9212300.1 filamentous hemagglutinin N-terminal domain-containing protein [Plectonema cf. radiosum LEGE 06105]